MAHAARFSAAAALPKVCSAMSLYLDNPATEAILLHPVQRRVVDAVDSVRDVLQRLHAAKVRVFQTIYLGFLFSFVFNVVHGSMVRFCC